MYKAIARHYTIYYTGLEFRNEKGKASLNLNIAMFFTASRPVVAISKRAHFGKPNPVARDCSHKTRLLIISNITGMQQSWPWERGCFSTHLIRSDFLKSCNIPRLDQSIQTWKTIRYFFNLHVFDIIL